MGELQRQYDNLLRVYGECALDKAAWIRWYKEQFKGS